MKKTLTCLAIMISALIFGASDVDAVQIKTEDIENSTYVIGTHMFTREGSEYYNGVLTTDFIMLASQTINSNKLEDMIIYYKNPRGKWLDVLKNEEIEVEDTIEITHKNNALYMVTPVLRNDTVKNWEGQFEGEYKPLLYDGVYSYDLAIDKATYRIGDDYDKYNVTGYAIYEKTTEGYKLVEEHQMTGSEVVLVEVEPGEKKEYVARVYATDSDNTKHYSDYSNVISIDHTEIKKPTLTVGSASEDTVLYLGFTIYTEGYYTTDIAQIGISGWELYEKVGNSYNLLDGEDVEIYAGETKTYVARAYALNKSGEKIYSDYSNKITESKTVKAPTLTSGHGAPGVVGFSIYMEGHYSITGNDNTIDGWELYEKVGNSYNLIEGTEGLVDRGEIKTYIARAYALNKNGEKIYSDYSNEYIADCTVKTPTLTAAYGSPGFVGFTIYTEGHYEDELNAQTIEGWELYEKVGNNYNLVEGNEVELNEDETRTFVARAYALNNNDQKVYSNYSNEVTVGNTN